MFRTAVKQLLRTPWKTLLFFLLLALSAGLLVVGANLYYSCTAALREAAIFVLYATAFLSKKSSTACLFFLYQKYRTK